MFGHEAGCGGTITITVTPVNDPPVAGDQTLVTDEDTPLPIALAGTDADGDTLSFTRPRLVRRHRVHTHAGLQRA